MLPRSVYLMTVYGGFIVGSKAKKLMGDIDEVDPN